MPPVKQLMPPGPVGEVLSLSDELVTTKRIIIATAIAPLPVAVIE